MPPASASNNRSWRQDQQAHLSQLTPSSRLPLPSRDHQATSGVVYRDGEPTLPRPCVDDGEGELGTRWAAGKA